MGLLQFCAANWLHKTGRMKHNICLKVIIIGVRERSKEPHFCYEAKRVPLFLFLTVGIKMLIINILIKINKKIISDKCQKLSFLPAK